MSKPKKKPPVTRALDPSKKFTDGIPDMELENRPEAQAFPDTEDLRRSLLEGDSDLRSTLARELYVRARRAASAREGDSEYMSLADHYAEALVDILKCNTARKCHDRARKALRDWPGPA